MQNIDKQLLYNIKCDIYKLLQVIKKNERVFHKKVEVEDVLNNTDLINNSSSLQNFFNNKLSMKDE